MATINFLLPNDVTTLIFHGSLEESNLAFPECGSDPIVCLLVEEG